MSTKYFIFCSSKPDTDNFYTIAQVYPFENNCLFLTIDYFFITTAITKIYSYVEKLGVSTSMISTNINKNRFTKNIF